MSAPLAAKTALPAPAQPTFTCMRPKLFRRKWTCGGHSGADAAISLVTVPRAAALFRSRMRQA